MIERIKNIFRCQVNDPIKPMKIVRTVYPDTKITFNEYSEHIYKNKSHEKNNNNSL